MEIDVTKVVKGCEDIYESGVRQLQLGFVILDDG